jgi:hypothetical protein
MNFPKFPFFNKGSSGDEFGEEPDRQPVKKPSPLRTFIIDILAVGLLLGLLIIAGKGERPAARRQTHPTPQADQAPQPPEPPREDKAVGAVTLAPSGPKALEKETGAEAARVAKPAPAVAKPAAPAPPAGLHASSGGGEAAHPAPVSKNQPAENIFTDTEIYLKPAPPVKSDPPAPSAAAKPAGPKSAAVSPKPAVERKNTSTAAVAKTPTKEAEIPAESITSRPVARDMPVAPEKPVERRKEAEGYRLRFAVCQIKENCEKIKTGLTEKRVEASLEKTTQELETHHAALGPWHTATEARQMGERLMKKRIKTSLMSSGEKFYLVTEPELSLKKARETLAEARKAGIDGKSFTRRESQEVFKVYGESFGKRDAARQKMDYYRRKGIDCVVEGG